MSYNQFLGDLYRVRGELLDKAIDPDPMVPAEDCTQVLQIPMDLPGGSEHASTLLHWSRN